MELALFATAGAVALYSYASFRRSSARLAQIVYGVSAGLIGIASVVFMGLILGNHFEYDYIYNNSSRDLAFIYKISAFWAGQQGSFLFWAFCVAALGVPLMWKFGKRDPMVMGVWGAMQGFLIILLLMDSPFKLLTPDQISQITDGYGLRELLQNPWMAIHPPVILLGYAAISVPGAFALASLIKGKSEDWIKQALPWTVFAWVVLGLGIILGAYWSYEVLGWGGYWAWDPVENASLVPWLTGTALLHGMIAERYRGSFRKINIALAILTLVFVFDATFLTRTDALKDFSVHTFGGSPVTGPLVWFMRLVVVASIALLVRNWKKIKENTAFTSIFSRDFAFFVAVALLTISAGWVICGTSMPIIGKFIGSTFYGVTPKDASSVSGYSDFMKSFLTGKFGPDQAFYYKSQLPVGLMLLVLMSLVPILSWKRDESAGDDAKGIGVIIAAVAMALPFVALKFSSGVNALLAGILAVAAISAFVSNLCTTLRYKSHGLKALGGFICHVGLGIMFIGVVFAANADKPTFGSKPTVVSLPKGKPTEVKLAVLGTPRLTKNYTLTYDDVQMVNETSAKLQLHLGTREIAPGMQVTKENQILSTPAIVKGFFSDVYVSPLAIPTMQEQVLERGKATRIGDADVTFDDFVLPDHDGMTVGAKLKFKTESGVQTITPFMTAKYASSQPNQLVDIPGTNATITINRIMVDEKAVEISLASDATMPAIAKLVKGQPQTVAGYKLLFTDWQMNGEHGSGEFSVGVKIDVTANGNTTTVTPVYNPSSNPEVVTESTPVEVPGTNMKVELEQASVSTGQVQIKVLPGNAEVGVSIKPGMTFLWVGSLIALIGGCIAVWRRSSEVKEEQPKQKKKSR